MMFGSASTNCASIGTAAHGASAAVRMNQSRWAWLMRERTLWVRAMSSAVITAAGPGPGRS
ncbi:hypothetical protein [Rhodococcus rhodochrous]|uniref:hypothetical protein n=1 Tax=Rhodococcus rhodochrous TaxID=1829 RepID=UPI001E45CD5F|nr:hypothetical protein [Rhodococcus rhodochrous]